MNAGHTTGHNEPTVFVGTLDDLETDGSVKTAAAYPTSYANTMRGEWVGGKRFPLPHTQFFIHI